MALKPTIAPTTYTKPGAQPFLQGAVYDGSPMHRNRLAGIARMLMRHRPPSAGVNVLDIGCGLGHIAGPVAALGYRVKGIDVHPGSIESARRNYPGGQLSFEAALLEDIDLKQFDLLILSEVLEHVSAWQPMLRYLAKNMAPNARLILTVPNGWSAMELVCRPSYFLKRSPLGSRFVKTIKKWLNTADLTTANEQTPHVNFFRRGALQKAMQACGLNVHEVEGYFCLWPLWEVMRSRQISETWAARDYALAERLPMATRGFWCFSISAGAGPLRS